MSLLQHVMNVAGFSPGTLGPAQIKPGFTVTKVEWHGCMATDRKEVDVGDVIEHRIQHGRYGGVIVKYDQCGKRWEPYEHFRKVNDELEVWS